MQLEEIKISVSADTKDAIASLDKLSGALKTLDRMSKKGVDFTPINQALSKFATGIQNIATKTVDKLGKIADAFEKLNGVTVDSSVGKALTDLGEKMDGVGKGDKSGISEYESTFASATNSMGENVEEVESKLSGMVRKLYTLREEYAAAIEAGDEKKSARKAIEIGNLEQSISKAILLQKNIIGVKSAEDQVSESFTKTGTQVDAVSQSLETATNKADALGQRLAEINARHNNFEPQYSEDSEKDLATAREIEAEIAAETRLKGAIEQTTQARREDYTNMSAVDLQAMRVQMLGDKYNELARAASTSEEQLVKAAQQVQSAQAKYNKLADAEERAAQALNENAQAESKDAQATTSNALAKGKSASATNKETAEVNKNTNAQQRASASASKHSNALTKLAASFKRILLYRAIRGIITGVTKALGEGIQNLYQYSKALGSVDGSNFANTMDAYASTVLQLKNSIATALAPVISAIMPMLQKLAGYVIQAANALARFFAILNGQSTYTVAKDVATQWGDDAASSIGGANDAAEELKRTLLGFDEINALDAPNSGGSGGGGGAGGTSVSASDMFEEKDTGVLTGIWAELADWIGEIKDIGGDIIAILKDIWESPFVQAVVNTLIKSSLGGIKDGLNMIKDALGAIDSFLNGDLWGTLKHLGNFVIDFKTSVERAVQGIVKLVVLAVVQVAKSIMGFIADLLERFPVLEKVFGTTADNLRSTAETFGDGLIEKVDEWGAAIDKENQRRKLAWAATLDADWLTAEDFYASLENLSAETVDKLYKAYDEGRMKIEKNKIMFDCDGDGVFETILNTRKKWEETDKAIESNSANLYGNGTPAMNTMGNVADKYTGYKSWMENSPWKVYADTTKANNSLWSFYDYWNNTTLNFKAQVSADLTLLNSALNKYHITGSGGGYAYADGGLVQSGQIFLARESGPEMVGTIGNRTAVANNDQIVQGIANGVSSAMSAQNGLLMEQNSLLRQLLAKPSGVSTASIIEGLNRTNRRAGTTVVAMG